MMSPSQNTTSVVKNAAKSHEKEYKGDRILDLREGAHHHLAIKLNFDNDDSSDKNKTTLVQLTELTESERQRQLSEIKRKVFPESSRTVS